LSGFGAVTRSGIRVITKGKPKSSKQTPRTETIAVPISKHMNSSLGALSNLVEKGFRTVTAGDQEHVIDLPFPKIEKLDNAWIFRCFHRRFSFGSREAPNRRLVDAGRTANGLANFYPIAVYDSDGRGRGVATDVRRHPATDLPAAGTARPGMRGLCAQMLHATRGEVCLGAGNASRFSAPLPPTARFDRLLPAPGAICGCPCRSKGAILAETGRDLAKIGSKGSWKPAECGEMV
jgi:hypothetical protein